MNPAEILAELKLLKHGIDAAVRQAEVNAREYAETTRAKSLETDRGTVSLVRRKPTVRLHPARFLQWVQENHPDETTVVVRPAFAEAFTKSLRIVGDEVLTPEGEVLDFASVTEGAVYVSARLADEDKVRAVGYVAEHLDALIMPEVTSGE